MTTKFNVENIIFVLICFLVISLPVNGFSLSLSGFQISLFDILLISISSLTILLFKAKNIYISLNSLMVAILLMFFLIINLLFSANSVLSLDEQLKINIAYINNVVLILVIGAFITTSKTYIKIFKVHLITSTAIAFLGIIQFFIGLTGINLGIVDGSQFILNTSFRILGTFENPNNYSFYLLFGFASTSIFMVWGKRNYIYSNKFILLSLTFHLFAIIATSSKGAALTALFLLVLSYGGKLIYSKKSGGAIGFLIIGGIIGTFYILQEFAMNLLFVEEGTVNPRLEFWRRALTLFQEYPINGVGIQMFPDYSNLGFVTHNIYFALISETGIIGSILFLAIVGISFINTWKLFASSDFSDHQLVTLSILMGLIALLIHSNSIYSLSNISLWFLIALANVKIQR